MTFITPAQLRDAAAPTGNATGTLAELSDAQLTEAINEAQNKVAAYITDTFSDSNAPPLVRDLVTALAMFYGTIRYRKGKELSQYHPIVLRYNDAITTLGDILAGKISVTPPVDSDPIPTTSKPSLFNPLTVNSNGAAPSNASLFQLDNFGMRVVGGRGTVVLEESIETGSDALDEY